ncbi:MAG: transposase, partial [Okeania sp. SIO3C4]|nr:transposase [Okeania sp. SIO3C4]
IHPLVKEESQKSQKEYWSVSSIMHSIKGYSAKQILKIMTHIGHVWQSERYDRIVRNHLELTNMWEYIRQNPVKAGLSDSPENYPFFWQLH